jgi:6-phosphogluconate dehydrogenase
MNHKEMGDVFKQWKSGVLDSYLIDITTDIVSLSLMIRFGLITERCISTTTTARHALLSRSGPS